MKWSVFEETSVVLTALWVVPWLNLMAQLAQALIRLLGPRLRHWTTMIGSNPSLGLQWEQPGRFY